MAQPTDSKPGSARLSLFSKRSLWLGLALLVMGALLAQGPLLRKALHSVTQQSLGRSGLTFNADISGSPLGTCVLENIVILPKDQPTAAPPNIRSVRIQRLEFSVSLLALLQHGPANCLSSIRTEGVQAFLLAPEAAKHSRPLSTDARLTEWSKILRLPARAPDVLEVRDLNLTYQRGEEVLFAIRGASLKSPEQGNGALYISEIQCAGRPPITDLQAVLKVSNRHLTLGALRLTPSLCVEELQLDTSRNVPPSLPLISIKLASGDGKMLLQVHPPQEGAPWQLHWIAESFSGAPLSQFLGLNAPVLPEELSGEAEVSGNPRRSKTWTGHAKATWDQPLPNGQTASGQFSCSLADSTLNVQKLLLMTPEGSADAHGSLHLGNKGIGLRAATGEASITLHTENFGAWLSANSQPDTRALNGAADATLGLRLSKGIIQGETSVHLQHFETGGARLEDGQLEATVTAPLGRLLESFDLKHMAGNGVISLAHLGLHTPKFAVSMQEAKAAISLEDGAVRLWNMHLKAAENSVSGDLSWPLAQDAEQPRFHLELLLHNLAGAALEVRGERVAGSLGGVLAGKLVHGHLEGSVDLVGKDLQWGAFHLGQFRCSGESEGSQLNLHELSLGWSAHEGISTEGSVELASPYNYALNGRAQFPKLERLANLLAQLGLARQLGGSLNAQFHGSGALADFTGTGGWDLTLKDFRMDELRFTSVESSGRFEPGLMSVAPLKITTPTAKLGAQIEWSDNTLRIQNIALQQWNIPTISGYLMLPVTRDRAGLHWIDSGRIAGQLRAEKLDLANLWNGAGKPPALFGSVDCSLALSGTTENPSAAFNLQAKNLHLPSSPKFGPMELELKGSFASGALEGDASLRSPLGAPVRAELKTQVSPAALFKNPDAINDLPLSVHLQTLNANLQPLAAAWDGFRQINGNASLEATMRGTLRHPTWTAKLSANCPIIHFASDRAPALGDVRVSADYEASRLRIQSLRADLGGGSLQIQGDAAFQEPGNPMLNFSAKAHEVLAVRNRNLSIRLNGDLFLRGPWKRATIGGSAAAVKSRVQRDIDVLPLTALRPGASRELRAPGKPWFHFQRAPFSDWKFDVSLSSTPGDPILIRGNRLRGTADAELKLEGTGAVPTLHGAYRTSDLIASLPFARIEVSRGRVWFTRDKPFLPNIDFSAETEARNHRVRLYLSGSPEAPNVSINSEPPLGETELLTLLTTGSLPSDASENSQTMASRAATVLFQEFSDKVFKPSGTERLSALRRFNLDLSAVNSRTGHQESRLTYRLQNDLFLVGEVGADGDFAGRLKYVIRFR